MKPEQRERNSKTPAGMPTATLIGVVVGVGAGFRGGKLDVLLMRFTEMNMTLPAIVLTVLAFNLLGQGLQKVLDPKRKR